MLQRQLSDLVGTIAHYICFMIPYIPHAAVYALKCAERVHAVVARKLVCNGPNKGGGQGAIESEALGYSRRKAAGYAPT